MAAQPGDVRVCQAWTATRDGLPVLSEISAVTCFCTRQHVKQRSCMMLVTTRPISLPSSDKNAAAPAKGLKQGSLQPPLYTLDPYAGQQSYDGETKSCRR